MTPNEAAAKERERAMREQAWDEGLREGWEGEIPDYLWALNPYRPAK